MIAQTLTVTIRIGNAACADEYDALQILERVARDINNGERFDGVIRDENGNTVGRIEWSR
jgi:hypothetical protein